MSTTVSSSSKTEKSLSFFRSLRGKIIILLLAVSLIPLLTLGWMSYDKAKTALKSEAFNKLIAVRDIKAHQITNYFNERLGDIKVFSNNPSVIAATHAIHESIEDRIETEGLSKEEIAAQYRPLYLGKPNLRKANDDSAYTASHAQYHDMFKDYMEAYGYYDIFLVEPDDGYIIYSVAKEIDFATSLNDGPYAKSNLGDVFRDAMAKTDVNATYLEDFAYYEPSKGAAAFVASPIIHDNKIEAILIFQVAVDQIDSIMHKRSGLGDTGETILISTQDFLMRSNSPLFDEKTLFKMKVDTEATRAAAAGKTGTTEIPDYRQQLSLVTYTPLDLAGVKWALIAKIDTNEALASAYNILEWMLFIIAIGVVLVIIIAVFFSASIANPIRRMTNIAHQLSEGNTKLTVTVKRTDEIGLMSQALGKMVVNLQNVIEDIVLISRGLAEGNLQVKPQFDYQGDLVEIKTALETALSNQSNVVHDIVNISVGLATGKNVKAAATYQGDFVEIKTSLESASLKLLNATKENARQDWLKTGQSKIADLMSGEQDVTILSKKIISFLTTYVDAQVGLFYLLQDDESTVDMIASYAYTDTKKVQHSFKVGEGLVGQVMLEKKTFIRLHTPEEYVHITQSGLSISVPHQVILLPFMFEDELKGVIEIGCSKILTELQEEFLQQIMLNVGIAINTAESRAKTVVLLEQTQEQAGELQAQQGILQKKQEDLQSSNEELQSQSEELQSQSEELQSQQEELRQINEELEERTKELERQQIEVSRKNSALEESQVEMEKAKAAIEIKASELELASKYKSEFLANMSHELRTPLNSLLILAQLLGKNKAGNLSDKQVEYAKTIHSAGNDLLTLINEILDLSKVEAGKIEVQLEDVPLPEMALTLEQKFRHVAEDRSLTFEVTMTDNLPDLIHTDGQRVSQIINNLLSNAFKFTHDGGITVSITRPDNTDNLTLTNLDLDKTIAIHVTDSGIGIPADKLQTIFEAFQQADGSTNRRYGGTGLGLSISRQLSRVLGGDLFLRSEEGKGSTFTLYLPERLERRTSGERRDDEEASSGSDRRQSGGTSHSASPVRAAMPVAKTHSTPVEDDRDNLSPNDRTLLIIEDDRTFSKVVTELAQEKQFKYLIAEDGQVGLEMAEKYKPNAIFLDIGLPQLDGWTVMERLKDNPETRHIPVHFMSGHDHSMDAKKMGAIGYLRKPVNVEQLGDAFKDIGRFIDDSVKNVVILVDNDEHQQKIQALVGGDDIKTTLASTKADALKHLKSDKYECLVIDVEVENATGVQLLKELYADENLAKIPVILQSERDLNEAEQAILQQVSVNIAVKTVKSPERLLDEATLFLHQVEADLPEAKQKMLRVVHDKEAILKGKKVLLADDDIRNTFALMTVLEEKEMEVVVANNGKEALEFLEDNPDVAVVLMDIMMPEMDGYEAIGKIRENPRHRELPILALTAKAMKGDKAKCIEAGANDYLAKPLEVEKLFSMLRVWLYR